MYCKNCGNKCDDDAKYCRKCGAPLSDYDDQSDEDFDEPEKKHASTGLMIGSIAAVVLIVIAAVLIMINITGKKQDTATDKADALNSQTEMNADKSTLDADTDKADEGTAEDADTQTEENQNDLVSVDWKSLYLDYLNTLKQNGKIDMYVSAGLIYVDDDDIPELYLEGDCEATGCLVLTCGSGTVDELQTSRLYFNYIERQNLLDNNEGHMGYYYDYIFSIEDGKWKCIAEGTYNDKWDETTSEYVVDDAGEPVMEYTWNNETTDEAGYDKQLKAVYDGSKAIAPEGYTFDELYSILETGKTTSADHRYELIVANVTWKEAEELCRQRGGYLATLTSRDEFDRVTKQIEDEGKTGITFFVGATSDEAYVDDYSYHWVHDNQKESMYTSAMIDFWLPGEPSYTGTDSQGETVDEMYVDYIYRKSEGRGYLNDVTNDLLEQSPSLKDSIGYICEYNS